MLGSASKRFVYPDRIEFCELNRIHPNAVGDYAHSFILGCHNEFLRSKRD